MSDGSNEGEIHIAINPRLLVACIGDDFMPGVWEAIEEARRYFDQGSGHAYVLPIKNM